MHPMLTMIGNNLDMYTQSKTDVVFLYNIAVKIK